MMKMMKTSWRQIRRTPYQALVAVMVMFLTFLALSIFSLISAGSIQILRYFESAPQVIAFFEKGKDVSSGEINKIKIELEKTGKLADFKYVSIHEAEAIYKEKNKDDPLLLELVDYKILPPSIEISATDIDSLPVLKNVLEKQEGVEDIAFYEDIVSSLSSWIKNIKIFGIALVSYLLIQSLLVVITIIGMKILARKDEIEIMKLIGAHDWFIRWPFVLEGIFYGAGGAFLAWGAAYILILYSTPFLLSWVGDISLLPIPFWFMLLLLLGEVLVGALVGFFGSLFAVRRFLRK
jgi:cell division transport system permease protein